MRARRGGNAVVAAQGTRYDQERLLRKSCTLYVGNLSFYTTEEQIHELFGKSGDIKKVIMGLDKVKKTACGFCFVEYPSAGPATLEPGGGSGPRAGAAPACAARGLPRWAGAVGAWVQ